MYVAPDPVFTATLEGAPSGRAGNLDTVRRMRAMVDACKVDPAIIQTATNVVYMQPQLDDESEARSLFEFVRDRVRYVRDVAGIETLSDPRMTLRRYVGDCDDQCALLAALLESVGYPCRFVLAGYNGPEFEHVYCQCWVFALGRWVDMDPTVSEPMGWAPPYPVTQWIEPAWKGLQ